MADPMAITFGLLASSGDPQSVDLLVAGLDSEDPLIRRHAASAMSRRGSGRGLIEVIRRLQILDMESRNELTEHATKLSASLRQCLLHGDAQLRINALELTLASQDFDQIDSLVTLLRDRGCVQHEQVAQTVNALTDLLFDHSHLPSSAAPPGGRYLRNAPQVRSKYLNALDQGVSTYAKLALPEPLVHSILVLAEPEHLAAKRLLANPSTECRDLARRLLMTDTHPGVMRLILESISRNYPLPYTLDALSRRRDVEFITTLLRWMPERLTVFQQKNLRSISNLAWIDDSGTLLEQIPPGLQSALVTFLSATGVASQRKIAVQEWLVRHGTPEGRGAASGVLDFLDNEAVQGILEEGLESEDADVQAWATTQIRPHAIPNAMAMLVERLDSPLPAVREAAQQELSDFSLERLLDLFEHLDHEACRRAGVLLRKIDPYCTRKLDRELSHAVRRRRIRAARATHAFGLAGEVAPALLVMLDDDDALVRRTAVEVLADVGVVEIQEVLIDRLKDDSPRVRDAAKKSLERWNETYGGVLTAK